MPRVPRVYMDRLLNVIFSLYLEIVIYNPRPIYIGQPLSYGCIMTKSCKPFKPEGASAQTAATTLRPSGPKFSYLELKLEMSSNA